MKTQSYWWVCSCQISCVFLIFFLSATLSALPSLTTEPSYCIQADVLSAGMVLLRATETSHCWLMGKCSSYISNSISGEMEEGGWLLVSLYNNGECWREGSDVRTHQRVCVEVKDIALDWWMHRLMHGSLSRSTNTVVCDLWEQVNLALLRLSISMSQGQLIVLFLLLPVYKPLSHPFLHCLPFFISPLYLFDFYTLHLIPRSLSTYLTSDNEVIYHHHVEKAFFLMHVFSLPGKDMFLDKIAFLSPDSVNPPKQSL